MADRVITLVLDEDDARAVLISLERSIRQIVGTPEARRLRLTANAIRSALGTDLTPVEGNGEA